MTNDKPSKPHIQIVAIVAIVAIVGLIVLFFNTRASAHQPMIFSDSCNSCLLSTSRTAIFHGACAAVCGEGTGTACLNKGGACIPKVFRCSGIKTQDDCSSTQVCCTPNVIRE